LNLKLLEVVRFLKPLDARHGKRLPKTSKGVPAMMNLRCLFLCAAVLLMGIANAYTAQHLPYEAGAFQSALQTGKPILVHVTAPWCRQCNAQKPIVAEFGQRPEFKDLTIFNVDFDTQKEALHRLNVQKQSTLVVFKGKLEVARAVGITSREEIDALMKKAL
jgi:thiol-disulfide isomerase/thioredoxin